jgi:predicted helicase
VLRYDLEDRDFWPESYAALEAGQKPQITKATPRPHQQEALDATLAGLQHNDRGQVIMACGTGKTLVALWLYERLPSQSTLVVLASLSLLNQTLLEWTKHTVTLIVFPMTCCMLTLKRE